MAFFMNPGAMFLGCLGPYEQRFLMKLIETAVQSGYTKFVEPCAGTFAMANLAGYAAYELFGNFHTYMWKRLVVVSAEDCYGIMTKEIIALKCADDFCNSGRKGYDRDPLFVAKAITLLCLARKNRDACYVACNFMLPDRCLDENEIEHIDIKNCQLGVEDIPDWVFDVHTLTGKKRGKTDLDMTIVEQAALEPKQMSLFDNCSWENYYTWARSQGKVGNKEWADFQTFKKGRKLEPEY